MLVTAPKAKKQMTSIVNDFVSQLTSLYQTIEGETQTEQSIQSWIASSLPLDDSVREIDEVVVRVSSIYDSLIGHDDTGVLLEGGADSEIM